MHNLSEVTKLQCGKNTNIALYFTLVAPLPSIFFPDSSSPYQDLLYPHSHKLCKNTSVLGGTVLKLTAKQSNSRVSKILLSLFRVADDIKGSLLIRRRRVSMTAGESKISYQITSGQPS